MAVQGIFHLRASANKKNWINEKRQKTPRDRERLSAFRTNPLKYK